MKLAMKLSGVLGVLCAAVLHGGFLLFGGLLFPRDEGHGGTRQEVELLSDEPAPEQADEPKVQDTAIQSEEEPPDAAEIIENLETPALDDAPALDAASLGAIEALLDGLGGGGGDFAQTVGLQSGGRIGGTGSSAGGDDPFDGAFDLAELDQKPRPVLQASPMYPTEMRGRKVEGLVAVIFVVDAAGKVVNPRIEKSNFPAFDAPALAAVKKWRFEPAVKGGQRVPCRMRAPIRFPPR
jgi:protein TonB